MVKLKKKRISTKNKRNELEDIEIHPSGYSLESVNHEIKFNINRFK